MKTIGVAVCMVLMCTVSRATEEYFFDDVDLTGQEMTITVASGATNTYTGAFSGSGSISKTGSGMLVLSPAENKSNTFSGGVKVAGGVVRADAQGAFGTGTISVTSSSGQVFFNSGTKNNGAAYTEFTNDIEVTVGNSAQTVVFYADTLIRGDITGAGNMILRHNPNMTSPGYGGPYAAIYGTVETEGIIRYSAKQIEVLNQDELQNVLGS